MEAGKRGLKEGAKLIEGPQEKQGPEGAAGGDASALNGPGSLGPIMGENTLPSYMTEELMSRGATTPDVLGATEDLGQVGDFGSLSGAAEGVAPGAEAGTNALGGFNIGPVGGVTAAIPVLQSLYNISQGMDPASALGTAAGGVINALPAVMGGVGGSVMSGIGAIPGLWEMANDLFGGGYDPQETNNIKRDFGTAWEPYKAAIGTPAKVAGMSDPAALRSALDTANYQLGQAPAVSQYISTYGGYNPNEKAQDLTDILPYSQKASTDSTLAYTLAMDKLAKLGQTPEMGPGEGQANVSDIWANPRAAIGGLWNDTGMEQNWADRARVAEQLGLSPKQTSRWNYGGPDRFETNPNSPDTYQTRPTQWDLTPEQMEMLSQPGSRMEGLRDIFSGMNPNFGGSNLGREFADLGFGVSGGGGNVGGINPEQVGGAGKLSPNFITPELDLRAEQQQGAGRLGGPQQKPGMGGKPFGMGNQAGGMQVGGGRQGNVPFGGSPNQTMMPQSNAGMPQQKTGGSRGAV